ncbi:MAG: hypothetical protein K2X27_10685 [Candidatus Obscuribacterales bacterium]|nr:hypothetical protein [Candidatus Obscuribacterales bacterium]
MPERASAYFALSVGGLALMLVLTILPPLSAANLNSSNLELSPDAMAVSAMSEATNTNTSGRCYAAVCRALHPLGIQLSGAAAYQARDILLCDNRFTAIFVNNVEQLRRGDIIVYDKSSSHPYGHIAVYQGNFIEASDHVSSITHTQNYGGATVFRLIQNPDDSLPPLAPDYRKTILLPRPAVHNGGGDSMRRPFWDIVRQISFGGILGRTSRVRY